jgi:NAD+ diphosphatase
MSFTPAVQAATDIDLANSHWLVFCRGKLLVKLEQQQLILPNWQEIKYYTADIIRQHYLGKQDGLACQVIELGNVHYTKPLYLYNLREAITLLPQQWFTAVVTASQVLNWDKQHQYCPYCATPLQFIRTERAKICPNCKLRQYPRISPAMIVMITKGEQVLLSRSPHFKSGMYSVQAGYLEAGENVEQAIIREVMEEVGLKIKNLNYFGSQAWPFPHSLMLAFTAEYASGELKINKQELEDASWYSVHNLPTLPATNSIAWQMLNSFIRRFN